MPDAVGAVMLQLARSPAAASSFKPSVHLASASFARSATAPSASTDAFPEARRRRALTLLCDRTRKIGSLLKKVTFVCEPALAGAHFLEPGAEHVLSFGALLSLARTCPKSRAVVIL